jgi:hypothetical protein
MTNLLSVAKSFTKKGISVIATDASKRAVMAWKPYQSAIATEVQLKEQFENDRTKGLAIICGAVSGSLEVIDVDVKYDTSGTLFENLMSEIAAYSMELINRLMVVQTKSGGYHIYYKCEVIEGNQKLAQRPATEEEIKANPNEKVLVLIETRGEGGYVCAPPTEGYTLKQGSSIKSITPLERECLLEIARSFNQYVVEQPKPYQARTQIEAYATTPWEDYNLRGVENMLSVLEKHGWKVVGNRPDKIIFGPAIPTAKAAATILILITSSLSLLQALSLSLHQRPTNRRRCSRCLNVTETLERPLKGLPIWVTVKRKCIMMASLKRRYFKRSWKGTKKQTCKK